jgi:hypothetical protein
MKFNYNAKDKFSIFFKLTLDNILQCRRNITLRVRSQLLSDLTVSKNLYSIYVTQRDTLIGTGVGLKLVISSLEDNTSC